MKQAVITFSKEPTMDNGFGLIDYVENVTSITHVIQVLSNYYPESDMALITNIEIKTIN